MAISDKSITTDKLWKYMKKDKTMAKSKDDSDVNSDVLEYDGANKYYPGDHKQWKN